MNFTIAKDSNFSDHRKCPACGYIRKDHENVPAWQCPQCGIAYAKATTTVETKTDRAIPTKRKSTTFIKQPSLTQRKIVRLLDILIVLAIIVSSVSYYYRHSLPPLDDIAAILRNPPQQTSFKSPHFTFEYRGNTIEVEPVARYELWGLIASQNIAQDWLWGYSEEEANFKDICVLWGNNLATDSYRRFKIWNSQWTCHITMSPQDGHKFDPTALSNNHLLTSDPQVKEKTR